MCLEWQGKSVIDHQKSLLATLTGSVAVWTFLEEMKDNLHINTHIPSSLQQHWVWIALWVSVFSAHPFSENHREGIKHLLWKHKSGG